VSGVRNVVFRPPIAVGVGVTGHSDLPRLDEPALRRRVGEVLEIVKSVVEKVGNDPGCPYSSEAPALRIISGLAAGADQIVASEALEGRHGFTLSAAIPFDEARYRADFDDSPEALTRFEGLLERAEGVVQLHGPGDGPARSAISYEAVGSTILSHSDLLIAVWDGEGARGKGGTAEVVRSAHNQKIPVIWIDAASPHAAGLLTFSRERPGRMPISGLEVILEDLLTPPPPEDGRRHGRKRRPSDPLRDFLDETDPRSPPAGGTISAGISRVYRSVWRTFFNVLAPPTRDARDSTDAPAGCIEAASDAYRPLFELADHVARHYAALYRSSFLINYTLGALAVTSALLAYAMHRFEAAFIVVELLVILAMLVNLATAGSRRWQTRSVDYRLLAEQLRLMVTFAPLGQVTPFPRREPFHRIDPTDTWTNWYFRAVVRSKGLMRAELDEACVEACQGQLHEEIVRGQMRYHRTTAERYRTLERRLHWFALWMFTLTGVSCAAHLVPFFVPADGWAGGGAVDWLHHHSAWLTLFAAALPAWGAASHAVLGQAEARRLAERYESMVQLLEGFDRTLAEPAAPGGGSARRSSLELIREGERVAVVLLDEVVDWRVVYQVPRTVLT